MVLQPFFLLATILMVAMPTTEGKNYYLMENEVENSQYVYSLFGLNIISKSTIQSCFSYLMVSVWFR